MRQLQNLIKGFLRSSIGFYFDGKQLLPLKERFSHENATLPALLILSKRGFEGPEMEFRSAYEHYKNGKYEESIVDSLKAFESMMISICELHGWAYSPKDSAAKLVKIMISNNLILSELQAPLESGLPPIRNKLGGHGTGSQTRDVPKHVALYALNLAASNITMLGEANEAIS